MEVQSARSRQAEARIELDGARKARLATFALSVAVLAVAGFAATRIGTEFIPNLDEGAIAINVVRLPNASLEGSVSVGGFMERRLRENFPEVTAAVSKTGRAEISEDPMGPEQTDVRLQARRAARQRDGKWPPHQQNPAHRLLPTGIA